MFIYRNGRFVYEADKGTGGVDLPADVLKSFEKLLERNGNNANAVAQLLFNENKDLRDQKRQLESRLPAEGAVILTGADAQSWAAYTALGKPEEVKQGLDERTQLKGKLTGMERDTILRSVADTVGYKPSVLANLDRIAKVEGKELSFDVRDTTVDGKVTRVAYVKDGDKELPLRDYAATNWADFLPALTVQGPQTQTQTQTGTRYPAQHAGSNNGGKPDPVADFLQREETNRAKVKNPLLKE